MRRRRVRTWAKWAATLAAGIAVGVAVASGFWWLRYNRVLEDGTTVRLFWIEGGVLRLGELDVGSANMALQLRGWRFYRRHTWDWSTWRSSATLANGARWRAGVDWQKFPKGWQANASLLWPVLLTTIPAAFLWYKDRRRFGPHACTGCGYDKSGLPADSPCPECGTVPTPQGQS
jgi:hypothetical protein